jgi:hypothetical protein
MTADWLGRSAGSTDTRALSASLCVAVAAPLAAGLPAVLRLQFSVAAMAAMLFCLWRVAQRQADPEPLGVATTSLA